MEFYTVTYVKSARKSHICHICGTEIKAGNGYHRESGLWEGDFFDRCTCPVCYAVREEYLSKALENEYDEWSIIDHVCGGFCSDKCRDDHDEVCTRPNPLLCPRVREYYGMLEEKQA